MSEESPSPAGTYSLRWKLLLVASAALALVALVLVLHAFGAITLGFLAAEPSYVYERRPLDVTLAHAIHRFHVHVEAHRYVEATRTLDALEHTAATLLEQRRAGQQEVDRLTVGLEALHAEIVARRAMRFGAPRLAYDMLLGHTDQPAHPPSVQARIAALVEVVKREVERFEPVVQGLAFVAVPAGQYAIGTPPDEAERRDRADDRGGLPDLEVRFVSIPEAYWISTTEVPRSVYGRTALPPSEWKGQARAIEMPASHLSFVDAEKCCAALSEAPSAYVYRLPTEAEWEVACRAMEHPREGPFVVAAADQRKFDSALSRAGWANRQDSVLLTLTRYAVFDKNCRRVLGEVGMEEPPVPVKQRAPNRIGLYDMHGGVAEWCRTDVQTSTDHVVRGGHCSAAYRDIRAGARRTGDPTSLALYGFRVTARRKPSGP